jgi:uncharacterized membrane-anchored protein YhcB (DUF1043 family)
MSVHGPTLLLKLITLRTYKCNCLGTLLRHNSKSSGALLVDLDRRDFELRARHSQEASNTGHELLFKHQQQGIKHVRR